MNQRRSNTYYMRLINIACGQPSMIDDMYGQLVRDFTKVSYLKLAEKRVIRDWTKIEILIQ